MFDACNGPLTCCSASVNCVTKQLSPETPVHTHMYGATPDFNLRAHICGKRFFAEEPTMVSPDRMQMTHPRRSFFAQQDHMQVFKFVLDCLDFLKL